MTSSRSVSVAMMRLQPSSGTGACPSRPRKVAMLTTPENAGTKNLSLQQLVADLFFSSTSADSSTFSLASSARYRGQTKAVFWPRYRALDANEKVELSAEVLEKNKSATSCCSDKFFVPAFSGVVSIATLRGRLGQAPVPLDGCNRIIATDTDLELVIHNPASFPIYARIN